MTSSAGASRSSTCWRSSAAAPVSGGERSTVAKNARKAVYGLLRGVVAYSSVGSAEPVARSVVARRLPARGGAPSCQLQLGEASRGPSCGTGRPVWASRRIRSPSGRVSLTVTLARIVSPVGPFRAPRTDADSTTRVRVSRTCTAGPESQDPWSARTVTDRPSLATSTSWPSGTSACRAGTSRLGPIGDSGSFGGRTAARVSGVS